MRARDVFLIMLKHAGGAISGKTLIQKRGFFLDRMLDLGLNYGPHYYGPYSAVLDAAIGQCKALGFVEEKITGYGIAGGGGFEVKRFDYRLTPDGSILAEAILERDRERCNQIMSCLDRIVQAGDLDYNQLSVAAKAIWVLDDRGKAMTPEDISEEARTFGWNVSDEAIRKAVGFLEKLGLVTRGRPGQA